MYAVVGCQQCAAEPCLSATSEANSLNLVLTAAACCFPADVSLRFFFNQQLTCPQKTVTTAATPPAAAARTPAWVNPSTQQRQAAAAAAASAPAAATTAQQPQQSTVVVAAAAAPTTACLGACLGSMFLAAAAAATAGSSTRSGTLMTCLQGRMGGLAVQSRQRRPSWQQLWMHGGPRAAATATATVEWAPAAEGSNCISNSCISNSS